MSNDKVVTASTLSAATMPGVSVTLFSRLPTERCGTRTPLGRPVEPEVKIT